MDELKNRSLIISTMEKKGWISSPYWYCIFCKEKETSVPDDFKKAFFTPVCRSCGEKFTYLIRVKGIKELASMIEKEEEKEKILCICDKKISPFEAERIGISLICKDCYSLPDEERAKVRDAFDKKYKIGKYYDGN